MSVERLFFMEGVKWELSILMGTIYKIFETVIDLVTPIIFYVLLLELLVGVINILLNIKSVLFRTFGAFLVRYCPMSSQFLFLSTFSRLLLIIVYMKKLELHM